MSAKRVGPLRGHLDLGLRRAEPLWAWRGDDERGEFRLALPLRAALHIQVAVKPDKVSGRDLRLAVHSLRLRHYIGTRDFKRLDEIAAPVLVATGDQERAAPAVILFVLFRELPNVELVVYPDSSH